MKEKEKLLRLLSGVASCFLLNFLFSSISFGHPLDNLKPGHWYEVPNSRLDSVDVCDDPDPALRFCPPGNIANVIDAWSGATFDHNRNQLLVSGGGHNDYGGNEIYAFDVDTMSWSRWTEPDRWSNSTATKIFVSPNGQPVALHTWNFMEHVPTVDKFFYFGLIAPYPNGGTSWRVCGLDMTTKVWDCNSYPEMPHNDFADGESRGANAVYDSATGDVWIKLTQASNSIFYQYDVSANQWIAHERSFVKWYTTADIDPDRRLYVLVGLGTGQNFLEVRDLDNPNNPPYTPSYTGPTNVITTESPGFSFDRTTKKFVGWTGSGDRTTVYTLDPATWTWEAVPAATTNTVTPTGPALKGTNGRWRYVPAYNAFILVNGVDENVYFYRLSTGTGAGQDTQAPSPPANLAIN